MNTVSNREVYSLALTFQMTYCFYSDSRTRFDEHVCDCHCRNSMLFVHCVYTTNSCKMKRPYQRSGCYWMLGPMRSSFPVSSLSWCFSWCFYSNPVVIWQVLLVWWRMLIITMMMISLIRINFCARHPVRIWSPLFCYFCNRARSSVGFNAW